MTELIRAFWQVRLSVLVAAVVTTAAGSLDAREIFVQHQFGDDRNPGTRQAPVRSIRRAVQLAKEGDTIHLLPERTVYREMITLRDKKGITIEGHNCIISGADRLPSDPAKWEKVGDRLYRISLRRTPQERHLLVVNGRAVTMGRTKYTIQAARAGRRGWDAVRQALIAQYPRPSDLSDGQFAWEPIDRRSGWLYVKGSLANLEWSVRTQGVYTDGHTHDITIRNLHVRHVLNDGFNFHGDAQNIRLINVTASECFDNAISPHGACSFTVERAQFRASETAVANDFLTETRFVDCVITGSQGAEIMIIGGKHLFERCLVRATAPVAMRLAYRKPGPERPLALKEIRMSGKDPTMQPDYTFRDCTVESADETPRTVVIQAGVNVTFVNCQFRRIRFQIDPSANVKMIRCTLDGTPLER